MELVSMNTMGLLTFEFDRDMLVPLNTSFWTGNNTYLIEKELQNRTGNFTDFSISIYPGEL